MLREIFLTLVIPGALIYGLFSASGATLTMMWIGFQRPYDFSWGMWNTLPVWQVAFAIAFLSNLFHKQLQPKFPPLLVIFLLLMAWITAGCFFAYLPERSWIFYRTFMIPLLFGPLLTVAIINDLRLLKLVLWVAAGSLGANAVKTGVSLAASGGAHITEQISGFVGDNNVFGLVLCLVVGILLGLRSTLPNRRWLRVLFYTAVAFVVLTIIYTKSRGAMLSLGMILVTASLLGGKPVRHLALLAVIGWFTWLVVPDEYFLRLNTLKDIEADGSAMGRVENWRLAWEAAVANPWFGVGIGNHIPYHVARGVDVEVRVAHSVYFQILGETGFVGFALYLAFVAVAWTMMLRTWREMVRVAAQHADLRWTRDVAFWMFCCYTGYLFGSGLLNMLYIEFPWYMVFFGAMLRPMVRAELAKRAAAVPGPTAGTTTVRSPGDRIRPIPTGALVGTDLRR